jgi:hypothetical protein
MEPKWALKRITNYSSCKDNLMHEGAELKVEGAWSRVRLQTEHLHHVPDHTEDNNRRSIFYPDDVSSNFVRNVSNYLPRPHGLA